MAITKFFASLTLFVMAVLASSPAFAQRRVALIIGNGAYTKVPKLANPANDAKAIEAMLRGAGFDKVSLLTNLGIAQMRRSLRDFSEEVRDADIAVIYYAGHGLELNGVNYLIPVDAVLERDIDVADEAISLDRVSQVLEPAKRLRFIILDACRDNPFARSIRRTLAGRTIGRGLAPIEVVTTDTLVAYAAKAGTTAADGEGANSPYARALIAHLPTPGLDVRLALGRVRDQVLHATSRRQEPFVYGSLGGSEVSLVASVSVAPQATLGEPERAWERIKETTDIAILQSFITRFGDTFYSDLARRKIDALTREVAEQRKHEAEAKKRAEEEELSRQEAQRKADQAERRRKSDDQAKKLEEQHRRKAAEEEKRRVLEDARQKTHPPNKTTPTEKPASSDQKQFVIDRQKGTVCQTKAWCLDWCAKNRPGQESQCAVFSGCSSRPTSC